MNIYEKRGICPYDCPDSCGFIAATDGSSILSVKGDPDHPITQGFLCRKMNHYEQDIHSPHRILTPLKRVGAKGDPDAFAPISWEEAIRVIGTNWREIIQNHGSDSILPYSYAGTMGMLQRNCGHAFFHRLGAANLERTICCSAKDTGFIKTMGNAIDWGAPSLADADVILLWGSNPKSNQLHAVPFLKEAKEQGAKIILIDVYRNASSNLCDEVLVLRPGTDTALILALMKELEQNHWIDSAFIERYTTGFEALQTLYRAWSPERAEKITGIPAEQIRALAKLYGTAKKSMIFTGNGMARYSNSAGAFQLLYSLPALTGTWAKGGGMNGSVGSGEFFCKDCITHPEWQNPHARTVNMNQLGTALNDTVHPIYSLYVYHSNPAVMTQGQQNILNGLARKDLFTVVHDRFLTDTALYADIILPATFSVEQDDIFSSYGHYHMQVGWKMIEPPGECKSNWDTFQLLAKEMGFQEEFFQISAKDFILERLENYRTESFFLAPVTEEQISDLKEGKAILLDQPDVMDFQTKDKMLHLNPIISDYMPPKDQSYPLRLVMVHSPWTLNSNFSYRQQLVERRGPLTLRIHPEDAKARQIDNGDLCSAYNTYGRITVKVIYDTSLLTGTVIAEGVYQKELTFGDGNFNSLTGEELTDGGKASPFNTYTIEIEKIAD